jgi:transcriptional regulator with XRE-family HTH domain
LRDRQGLTLEKASEAADLDLTHWQKVEAGKLNLTLVTLCRISDALEQPIESLFRSKRDQKPK